MSLLPRRGLLAIAAVVDIAVNARSRPVSARMLAERHGLPPRHLEPVLQALVHDGVLRGIRGPHGGYELAREGTEISLAEVIQAAAALPDQESAPASTLVADVILPAVLDAERTFSAALAQIDVESLARRVEKPPAGRNPETADLAL